MQTDLWPKVSRRSIALLLLLLAVTPMLGCATAGGGGGGSGGAAENNDEQSAAENSDDNGDSVGTTTDSGAVASGCGGPVPSTSGARDLPHYGLIPAPPVPRLIRDGERPAQVDLSEYVPTPCSQGGFNSCVAWVHAYGLMTYLAAENIDGWVDLDQADRQFSPTFVFNQANAFLLGRSSHDSCEQAGVFLCDGFTLLRDTGCATWDTLPYSEDQCDTAPPASVIQQAADFKIGYFRVVPDDVATIQSYLEQRIPVAVVLHVGDQFDALGPGDIYDCIEEPCIHAHAVLAVGYDEPARAIKVLNSWGTQWGDGGFGFISYDVWPTVTTEAYVVGRELITPYTSISEVEAGKVEPTTQDIGARTCADSPLLDSDGDGYPDTLELEFAAFGLDPLKPDDNPDYVETTDTDGDGWPDETEAVFGTNADDDTDFPFDCDYAFPDGFFDEAADEDGDEPDSAGGVGFFAPAVNLPLGGVPPADITVGDWDADGDPDLAVASQGPDPADDADGFVAVFLNDGTGAFAQTETHVFPNAPSTTAAADFDGDGNLDLAVATATDVALLIGNGDGTFADPVDLGDDTGPRLIEAVDLDADGDTDLVGLAANRPGSTVFVLLNNGDGSFPKPVDVNLSAGDTPVGLVAADLDNDADLDLAVAHSASRNVLVLLNRGNGTFFAARTYDVDLNAQAVVSADFNGDGANDLALADAEAAGHLAVVLNDGTGRFDAAPQFPPTAADLTTVGTEFLTTEDIDGDGHADLVGVTYRYADPLAPVDFVTEAALYLNNADGTFGEPTLIPVGTSSPQPTGPTPAPTA